MTIAGPVQAPDVGAKGNRTRDAAASKEALLQAAQELFGQKGFDRTTIREIGERAGVDAALIARYFGNKADLYVAAVAVEDLGEDAPPEYDGLEQIAEAVVTRADKRGPGPILQAIIRSDTSPKIRRAALDRVVRRLVEPLVAAMSEQEVAQPRLRAEVAVSALFGISLGRSLGWFDEVRTVPRAELVTLITETLGALTGGDDDWAAPPSTGI